MRTQRVTFETSETMTLVADRHGPRDRPHVLLFHGGGQTRWSWGRTAEAIAVKGFCVFAIDLRGHGESDWCPDGNYLLDHFAADVRGIVARCPSAPVIVGASLGGMSALLACGEDPPAPCAGLVLVDIAPRINVDGTDRVGQFLSSTKDGFASLDEATAAVAAYTGRKREARPEGLQKNLRKDDDGRYRWHWDPAFLSPRAGSWNPQEIETRMMAAANRIAAPTLIVRGSESDVLTEETMAHLQAALPHVEQAVVPGAGHMIAGDDNAAFNAAILPFVLARASATMGNQACT